MSYLKSALSCAGAVAVALSMTLFVSAPAAIAAEIEGVKFADQIKLAGKTLTLNGTGMRKATFLKVKVYAAGLYLEKPTKDPAAIVKSNELKDLELVFFRDVDGEDMGKALNDGIAKNCEGNCDALKPQMAKLMSLMSELKKGDVVSFTFHPDKTDVKIRNALVGSVEGKGFTQNLLRCWLGKNPPNEDLKDGLLGLKD